MHLYMPSLSRNFQMSPAFAALLLVQSSHKRICAQHIKYAVMYCVDIKMVIINLMVNIYIRTIRSHFQNSFTSQTLSCMNHCMNDKRVHDKQVFGGDVEQGLLNLCMLKKNHPPPPKKTPAF